LAVFRRRWLGRLTFGAARLLRDLGLMSRLARPGRAGFAMAMVAASRPASGPGPAPRGRRAHGSNGGGTVALFRGCIMDSLFAHVHEATRRTLEANGYHVVEVREQVCCGALHEHAGDRHGAEFLARRNVSAFGNTADFVGVNSAGCGALLKDYGHLLATAEARGLAQRVRDVTELLAARGPRPGGPLALDVAYDAPCHLAHAQRVHEPPLAVLRAIPGLRLALLPGADHCCGSAGIYALVEPRMSRAVLDAKIATYAGASPVPAFVLTGNPGCLMQIGAGLSIAGLHTRAAHPVELLDWSYQVGGVY
jgi:glycolate oxidase iron-sulfur subunit